MGDPSERKAGKICFFLSLRFAALETSVQILSSAALRSQTASASLKRQSFHLLHENRSDWYLPFFQKTCQNDSAYQGSPVPSEAAFFHSMREALLLWLPIAPAVVKEAG